MAKELIISSNRHETKVALFEDEQLVEIYFQRANEYSLAGSIHKGKVTRVLPGMQSAFVNIGLDRDAFLYVSDFFEESDEDYDKVAVPVKERSRSARAVDEDTGEPSDESNERIATAQTVAALVVKSQDAAEAADSNGATDTEEASDETEGEQVGEATAAPAQESSNPPLHSQRNDSDDDRRNRRRRRRKGRNGGLPESKFAGNAARTDSGTRSEHTERSEHSDRRARGDVRARRDEDEDSRWNRKPTAGGPQHLEDEDPPQSVMIAKVSDPNRLPPAARRSDFSTHVLPGESLAKYRRGAAAEGRKDFADRSRGDRSSTPHADAADSAGGRYSTPRKSRHGSRPAGFLAPPDDHDSPSGGSEEPEFDILADGASASLLAPLAPKARLAVEAEPEGGEPEAGVKPAAEAEEAPKKKTAAKKAAAPRKKATKAVKKAPSPRKRATKAAEPVVQAEEAEAAPERVEEPHAAQPEAPEELAASAVAEPAEAENASGGTDAEPVAAVDEPAAEAAAPAETTEATETDEPAAEDLEARTSDPDTARTGDDGHRLSRRDRRRLRMLEKRDERRRERTTVTASETDDTQGSQPADSSTEEPAPVVSARPERPAHTSHDTHRDRHGRDFRHDREGRHDRNGKSDGDSRQDRYRGKNSQSTTLITEVLKEGQEVLVQIAKEPLGQKGARITSHIALPGRYVVYMPTVEHVGVSRKVGTDQERLRLRKILQSGREGTPGGFICRTAAEGRPEAEIHADMQFLKTLWQEIKSKADRKAPPALIHHDLDIVQRVLRDQLTEEFKTIWVDNEELYERILRFVQSFQPSLVSRVRLYTKPAPIFDTFNVTTELEKALKPKVWLKSGGYIVINQTEALVAIDVNTGKFVGKSNRLEDTIVKTNLEAVKEAVRQIRLRDLGGIIVVDFIDMDERRNRQKVMQALDEEMKEDRAPYKILQFNDFGLVAITRKRVKQSLERTLCQPCPYCEGSGYIKNVQTVIGEILTEAQKLAPAVEGEVSLRVNPEVGKVLKSHTTNYVEELEEILKVPVIVTSDPLLHQEKFDLA
ncbi:MAG: Rne/Rng family ribonuclease [Bryobacterales bacterium]|nr:Rne/Rng family ribonuclease [Bryobacterales bacterium]